MGEQQLRFNDTGIDKFESQLFSDPTFISSYEGLKSLLKAQEDEGIPGEFGPPPSFTTDENDDDPSVTGAAEAEGGVGAGLEGGAISAPSTTGEGTGVTTGAEGTAGTDVPAGSSGTAATEAGADEAAYSCDLTRINYPNGTDGRSGDGTAQQTGGGGGGSEKPYRSNRHEKPDDGGDRGDQSTKADKPADTPEYREMSEKQTKIREAKEKAANLSPAAANVLLDKQAHELNVELKKYSGNKPGAAKAFSEYMQKNVMDMFNEADVAKGDSLNPFTKLNETIQKALIGTPFEASVEVTREIFPMPVKPIDYWTHGPNGPQLHFSISAQFCQTIR
ncbi:MAG: hypothetical protein K2X93_02755 [Candidatus Obscuribacterales bacterium]|nr:hypothetical protein [Candidatus Obscuribacterales bacterium]